MTDIHRAPEPLPHPSLSYMPGRVEVPVTGAVLPPPVPQPARRDPKKPKRRKKIEPQEAGQLEQLLVQFSKAQDEADVAKEQEAELKAQIKSWIISLFDDPALLPDAFDITGDPHGRYPGFTMTLKGGHRTDTEQMKQDGVYERYQVDTTPTWELRAATQGRRR
jgi:hypothetical protein